jgi:2-methylcitrate dehydratase PrpD
MTMASSWVPLLSNAAAAAAVTAADVTAAAAAGASRLFLDDDGITTRSHANPLDRHTQQVFTALDVRLQGATYIQQKDGRMTE